MNAALKLMLPATAGLLLSACATTPEMAVKTPQGAYKDVNQTYVAAVERGARIRGATVVWVNPPRNVDSAD